MIKYFFLITLSLSYSCRLLAKKQVISHKALKQNSRLFKKVSSALSQEKISSKEDVQKYFSELLGRGWEEKLNTFGLNKRYLSFLKYNLAELKQDKSASKVIYLLSLLPKLDPQDKAAKPIFDTLNLYISNPASFRDLPKFQTLISEFSSQLKKLEDQKDLTPKDIIDSFHAAVHKVPGLTLEKIINFCKL